MLLSSSGGGGGGLLRKFRPGHWHQQSLAEICAKALRATRPPFDYVLDERAPSAAASDQEAAERDRKGGDIGGDIGDGDNDDGDDDSGYVLLNAEIDEAENERQRRPESDETERPLHVQRSDEGDGAETIVVAVIGGITRAEAAALRAAAAAGGPRRDIVVASTAVMNGRDWLRALCRG